MVKDLTAAQGTVIGALIAGMVVAVGWFVSKPRRHGRWEAIKNDLDIVNLLPEDDPYRQWLFDYCRVRLVAYSASELDPLRRAPALFKASLVAAGLFLVGSIFALQYSFDQGVDKAGWDFIYPNMFPFLGCIFGFLASVKLATRSNFDLFRIRGLYGSDREIVGSDVQSLRSRIHAMLRAKP